MVKVSTRPQKAATPVAKAVTTVTVPSATDSQKAIENEATRQAIPNSAWRPLFAGVRKVVSPLLWLVHARLDDDICESAYRLSAIAARMFDQIEINEATEMAVVDEVIFDSLACIASAIGTEGQEVDELSLKTLKQASELIHALMYAMSETPTDEATAAVQEALRTANAVPTVAVQPPADDQPTTASGANFSITIGSNDWYDLSFEKESQFHMYARATASRLAALANFAMKSFDGEFGMAGQLEQVNELAYQLEQVIEHFAPEVR